MNYERALVCKVAQTGTVEQFLGVIDQAHFTRDKEGNLSPEGQVWQFLVDHVSKFRTPPSLAVVRSANPDFPFEIFTDSLEFIREGFIKSVKRRAAMAALYDLGDLIDKETEDIDKHFLEKARELGRMMPSTTTAHFREMELRIHEYERAQREGLQMGLPYGVPEIDRVTMGIQPHELVTLAGWSGTGKSTLMLYIAFQAYLAGKTVLVVSLEMSRAQVMRKFDTLATHFQYNELKRLSLKESDMAKWLFAADRAAKAPNDIIVKDNMGRCTVEHIYAEINRYKPDLVCVDYIGLMESSRRSEQRWQEITNISRDLKTTALELSIPIVSVAQTNPTEDGGFRGSNIAGSKSIMRDSDIMIQLRADEEMKRDHKAELQLIKNRDGETLNQMMLWDVGTMTFKPWRDTMPFLQQQQPVKVEPILADDPRTGIKVVEVGPNDTVIVNENGEIIQ